MGKKWGNAIEQTNKQITLAATNECWYQNMFSVSSGELPIIAFSQTQENTFSDIGVLNGRRKNGRKLY